MVHKLEQLTIYDTKTKAKTNSLRLSQLDLKNYYLIYQCRFGAS